ncbi:MULTISPECIES: glutaredoxin family protein [Micrococcaceae]|uniref:glutaredoxin family protein n=1 Tax=Micrococcaceae TaxID=1268 RepID=UPI00140D7801|nr:MULTISPECIES: glutaredoxin family protein [Micrococcaceae]MCX8452905.1 glutaredoxin family protein [Paenarthrobacter ureafaciens]MCY0971543.1 glutaredoxin family protein [Paenarthrobacter ureafaciens]MDJ0458298.1 glutaredoxin family protein [Arthrobacter sp. NQ7]
MTPTTIGDLPRTAHTAPKITIYGPAECPNCDKAKSLFDRHQPAMQYTKIDIEQGDENHRHITEDLGYAQAPVIVVKLASGRTVHWGGHRQDMLTALVRLCTKGIVPEDRKAAS